MHAAFGVYVSIIMLRFVSVKSRLKSSDLFKRKRGTFILCVVATLIVVTSACVVGRELQYSANEAIQKLAQAELKVSTMQTGEMICGCRLDSLMNVSLISWAAALETTQSELFELKNKFDERAAARCVYE